MRRVTRGMSKAVQGRYVLKRPSGKHSPRFLVLPGHPWWEFELSGPAVMGPECSVLSLFRQEVAGLISWLCVLLSIPADLPGFWEIQGLPIPYFCLN